MLIVIPLEPFQAISLLVLALISKATSYSPAFHCSTISVSGLNFSVRNGKRWNPATITTIIMFITSAKLRIFSQKQIITP